MNTVRGMGWHQRFGYRLIRSFLMTLMVFVAAGTGAVHGERLQLRVGYIPVLSQLPLVIAYDLDRLSYRQVDIALVSFRSVIALEAALRVKAIDVAYLPLPSVLIMRAQGFDVLAGPSLHQGGYGLARLPRWQESTSSNRVFGVPGISSVEHLALRSHFDNMGYRYGLDYKVEAVQLGRLRHERIAAHYAGLLVPEPYLTEVVHNSTPKLEVVPIAQAVQDASPTVLAFNREVMVPFALAGIDEWRTSLDRACRFLSWDIEEYDGAQTVITQQVYFGFSRQLVQTALAAGTPLAFGVRPLGPQQVGNITKSIMSMRLLLQSVTYENLSFSAELERLRKQ